MISAKVTLWLMLFVGISCDVFYSIDLNIAIVSMIKFVETSDHHGVRACNRSLPVSSNVYEKFDEYSTHSTVFEWSQYERNLVLGTFYALPVASPFVGGYLSHKYGVKVLCGWCTLIASLLSSLIPWAAPLGPKMVAAIRALQGIVACMSWPQGALPIIGKWCLPHERSTFLSVFAGVSFGTAFAYPFFGFIAHTFGWPYVFYATSAFGVMWFACWQYFVYDSPQQHPRMTPEEKLRILNALGTTMTTTTTMATEKKLPIPWRCIVRSIPFVASNVCSIGYNWYRLTIVAYVPVYFKEVHDLNVKEIGLVSGSPYVLRAAFLCLFPLFTDFLLRRELVSRRSTRVIAVFSSSVIAGLALLGVAFANCDVLVASAFVAASIVLSASSAFGVPASFLDMSPNFSGVMSGINSSLNILFGIFLPFVISWLSSIYEADTLEQWKMIWLLTSFVCVSSAIIFLVWGDSEEQPWNTVERENGDNPLLEKKKIAQP